MKKTILFIISILFSSSSIVAQPTAKFAALEEIDYLKIKPMNVLALGIIQNVKTDWGKLGLRGKVYFMSDSEINSNEKKVIVKYYFNEGGKIKNIILDKLNIYYIYDDKNQLIKEDHATGFFHEYSYDKKGLLEDAKYNTNESVSFYDKSKFFVFSYDDNGKIIKHFNPETGISSSFKYNANGQCSEELMNYEDQQHGAVNIVTTFTYNANNDLEESRKLIVIADKNYTDSIIENYTYVYDNQSNWIERICKNNKGEQTKQVRNIKYFDSTEIEKNNDNSLENKKLNKELDVPPHFPSGQQAMYSFINHNLRYPVEAQKRREQGRVIVSFIVTKLGKITDIKIIEKVSPLCDEEVIRIIRCMPKWIPGTHNGEVVDCHITLPILFRLI